MYVLNPEKIHKKYMCKYSEANYLMKFCEVPLLSKDGTLYIFADTTILREGLKKVPFWVKLLDILH